MNEPDDEFAGEFVLDRDWKRLIAERDAARASAERLAEALRAVERLDKTTSYDYGDGKTARDRNGNLPAEGRWNTPREIARAALAEFDSREKTTLTCVYCGSARPNSDVPCPTCGNVPAGRRTCPRIEVVGAPGVVGPDRIHPFEDKPWTS